MKAEGMVRYRLVTLPGRGGAPCLSGLPGYVIEKDGPEASKLRTLVDQAVGGEPPSKGNILAALRRSPLVGADST